jgi:hypothetical protein
MLMKGGGRRRTSVAEQVWRTDAPKGGESELAIELPEMAGQQPGGHVGLSINVSGIDDLVADLLAKGVDVVGMEGEPIDTVQQMPWGDRAVWLKDPDGNIYFAIESSYTPE